MAAVPKDHVQKKKGRKGRPQKNLVMAAVPKDQKGRIQKKKGRPSKAQKNQAKQSKAPSGTKKNICLLRLPKSCHVQNCPLMSCCFKKQMRDNDLFLCMARKPLSSFGATAYRMTKQMGGQKKQHRNHDHPDFLKATDKRHAKQKSAPGAKTAKPRKGCSNEENAYRLANPSTSNDVHTGPSGTDTMTLDVAESVPAIPQPLAGELQPVLS